jgi:serine/threonine protein kinase
MIGARGRVELHDFYANHFLSQIPPDLEMVTVSRTIGQGRVIDELIARFTHSIRMDWLLPGIPPNGKRVEFPFVVIVQFEGDKVAHEHLHQLLKRPCALKFVRPDCVGDPRALARFEREVRLTATLSHPNTVETYDYGRTADGTYYYVMEYLPGLSLAELVERQGPLPPGRAVYLLRQLCQALREAHAVGLIHRDIKPSNIIAAHRGGIDDVAKLLDFGLVRPAEAPAAYLSAEGEILGTPLFMSPEQAAGDRELDQRSDLYSLGAVAYHLLTGRPPFNGVGGLAVLVAHARDPVVPPSLIRPGIPEDLEHVLCGSWRRTRPIGSQMPRAWNEPCASVAARGTGTRIVPLGGGATQAGFDRRTQRPLRRNRQSVLCSPNRRLVASPPTDESGLGPRMRQCASLVVARQYGPARLT